MGKRLTIVLAVFALLAVPLGAYVGGYFWLGRVGWHSYSVNSSPSEMVREFDSLYLANIYQPAGKVESWLRGKNVQFWIKGDPVDTVVWQD